MIIFSLIILFLLPSSYLVVSWRLDTQNADDALLKRLSFIAGSIPRVLKMPEQSENITQDVDAAFSSSELIYPSLLGDSVLAHDYNDLKECWNTIKEQQYNTEQSLERQAEVCWLKANKTIFSLYYRIEDARKKMMNTLFFLGIVGALLVTFLLFQIYRYVRIDLETNLMIDLQSGLYNSDAFLEECVRNCIAANRSQLPFSVVLLKFPDTKRNTKEVKNIVLLLRKSCRREEKLYKIGPSSYALLTFNTRAYDLDPLYDRLQNNFAEHKERFLHIVMEYELSTDVEAFGPKCLEALGKIDAPAMF